MQQRESCLILDVRPGEHISLDGARIKVELVRKSGQIARLRVTAPRDVAIKKEKIEIAGASLASDNAE